VILVQPFCIVDFVASHRCQPNMSVLHLPQYGQVEAAKNIDQSDCYRSASAASIWLCAHIKSIANVKIIFRSSKIYLVQENIIDNVHMHLLTKLLCR